MQSEGGEVLRLKAVVEADAGALRRVLESLDEHGVVPLRVVAQRAAIRGRTGKHILEIQIDIPRTDLAPATLGIIAAKISEHPLVMSAVATRESEAVTEFGS